LFTGTRGVGKTTLSRILAKSLNCETGITATPCGQCRACTEIDGGRFVDYVELDAASNRGVDEMTQLLEQAVYAPSSGRFKVYMIDEVHMLSGHAFNAMLKTLEEPPPHVKFILATTDPQKIPPTVLSRCLQFNLKQMPPQAVTEYLQTVLNAEEIPFEPGALRLIGKAASGSMRDALSLTDQAIAYSSANLSTEAVRAMLGSVDQTHLTQLLQALMQGDAQAVLAVADALNTRGISFRAALAELAVLLSQLAIEQRVPSDPADAEALDAEQRELAQAMPADLLQLFYTVAVHGRQEMVLAPDEYAGFVMVCLKMLSFVEPGQTPEAQKKTLTSAPSTTPTPTASPATPPASQPASAPPTPAPPTDSPVAPTVQAAAESADESTEASLPESVADSGRTPVLAIEEPTRASATNPVPEPPPQEIQAATRSGALALDQTLIEQWPAWAETLPVTGMAQQLATQSACVAVKDNLVCLKVPTQALSQGSHVKRLTEVLSEHAGQPVRLELQVGELEQGSSAQLIADAASAQRQRQAEQIVSADPFVNALIEGFGAQVIPGSVRAVESSNRSVSS
jgi:DNA polymerase-3 subunit gamma/tau